MVQPGCMDVGMLHGCWHATGPFVLCHGGCSHVLNKRMYGASAGARAWVHDMSRHCEGCVLGLLGLVPAAPYWAMAMH